MPDLSSTPDCGCLVCGAELLYSESTTERACYLCGSPSLGTAVCARAHFVCDHCHQRSAAEVIASVCAQSDTRNPIALATELMRSPALKMHGPEHHFLVPAVLLATYNNALGQQGRTRADLAEARRRAERIPGGFCGSHGNCGAGVGTGVFWSVACQTTPLSTSTWSECNEITALSLLRIARHGGPRCCKRDTYHALIETMEQVGRRVDATRWCTPAALPICEHAARNQQCLGSSCCFHPKQPPG